MHPDSDEQISLARQVREFRQRLAQQGIVPEIDAELPAIEQLTLLHEARWVHSHRISTVKRR